MAQDFFKRYEHGHDEYRIEFRWSSRGYYVLYCTEHPYNPYVENPDSTHIHEEKEGMICVQKGREPRDMEAAESIAHFWMRKYSNYVRTGEPIASGEDD